MIVRLSASRICVVSRCARTLDNFRRSLIVDAKRSGAHVVALGAAGDDFEIRLQEKGIDFQHIPVSLRGVDPFADLKLLRELIAAFREHRPHLVHSFTIKPAIFGTIAAWVANVPVRIVTITGLGHAFTTAHPLVRKATELLYRFALAKAHVVFFQNVDDRELFLRRGLVDDVRCRLISGSGVDLSFFMPCALPSAEGDSPRFLMIGRVLKEKGVNEFVCAAKIVKEQYPGASFTLLGGVDRRNPSALDNQALNELRASDVVTWIDEVPDVRPYIAQADVVVLPSYREGLPRSLLEAGAMGRALVASDVPGCREVVIPNETGYLAPAKDARSLAEVLAKLCRHPEEIAKLGAAAQQHIQLRFDQNSVNQICLQTYAEQLELAGLVEEMAVDH